MVHEGSFVFSREKDVFRRMKEKTSGQMKVFYGSSNIGSGSSFQVPSLSGPVTCQEQGSLVSPQVFSSIPAPSASGHDEFLQALKDPEFAKAVRGLELCRKIRERERLQGDGGTAGACVPLRGGSSAGGNESLLEGNFVNSEILDCSRHGSLGLPRV